MKNPDRGIRVIALNNENVHSKFDIYLDFSGHREWLMICRHNGILFSLLKNGVSLGDLRRVKGRDRERIQRIVKVADEYIKIERSA